MTAPPARRVRRLPTDLWPDTALLAVALAAGLGAGRLIRGPATAAVVLPIAACAMVGHVVVSFVKRLEAPDPLPSVGGIVAVALAAVWTLMPRATRDGLPTATTVRSLVHHFSAAGGVIRSHPTPLPATSGVVLCLAAGAGLAAVFGRTLWAWQEVRPPGTRRPLIALFPSFGLFCYTALLSSDRDRVTGTALYLAAALLFLAAADRVPRPGRARRVAWRSGTAVALAMTALAVAVPVAASPGLDGLQLNAVPFSQGAGKGGPTEPGGLGGLEAPGVAALNLIDNMRAVLTSSSKTVLFTATTRVPTYWQVAVLSRFNGVAWLPDGATQAAANGAPQLDPVTLPVLPGPPATRTFTATVSVDDLRSTLLPVPPTTVAVANSAVVQIEPGIGALQPFATPEDLVYSAVARLPGPLGSSPSPSLAALDASTPALELAPYLTLPRVAPAVVDLAHHIVAGITAPAAEATALARYLSGGHRFRYTLNPPAVSGADPLSAFLFTTRAGFCQQFAGAFAVLARIDGLPTRLAIGFTTGTVEKGNTYSVTGADAHSWPEVYLGPDAGWVSFEPTPPSTDEPTGAGVQGATPTTAPSHASRSTTTTLSFRHLGQSTPGTLPAGVRGHAPTRATTTTAASAPWGRVLAIAAGVVIAIVGGALAGPWLWRRRRPRLRRRRFARGRGTDAEILARWEQAASVLARAGLARRPSETIEEHATRLVAQEARPGVGPRTARGAPGGGPATGVPRATDTYRALAELAERASYAARPCTDDDVTEARRLSGALREALRRREPVGR
jgi:transglutaminase-like putative cysteine protease